MIIGIRFQKLTLVMGAGVGCGGEDWRIWNDAKWLKAYTAPFDGVESS